MLRLVCIVLLVAFEATVVALPLLALTGVALPWLGLAGAVLVGWLADTASRRLRWPWHRLVLAVAPPVAATGLVGLAFGLAPVAVWAALLPGHPQSGLVYLTVLCAFFLVWRGVRLAEHDSATLLSLAGKVGVVVVAALLLGPLLRAGAVPQRELLLGYVVTLVGTGLAALALTHLVETATVHGQKLDLRWTMLLVGIIGSVLLVSVVLTATLSGDVTLDAVVTVLRWLLLPFALVSAGLVYLLTTVFGDLIRSLFALLGQALAQMNLRPEPPPTPDTVPVDDSSVSAVITLAQQATFVLALIPLAVLLIAVLLWQRRGRRLAVDEERESLDVGQSMLNDLRDLLGLLRNPFRRRLRGLQAVLATLRGNDPVTRVRRAYVQVLFMLEQRGLRRAPAQTPAEWYATVAPTLSDPAPLADLTAAYEQARYRPDGVDAAEAGRAEQAAQALYDQKDQIRRDDGGSV